MQAKLSIVATPIGNLEDITLRAIRTLKEADLVLCEDTRVTGKLLKHYEIETPLKRCDAEKEMQCAEKVVELLKNEKHIAYVSDAGTPGISDPGSRLVAHIREELPDSVIEVIPGASSLAAAFSIAGIPDTEFCFLGFMPHKKGRETLFKKIAEARATTIFFESPNRILKTLASLTEHLEATRRVVVARELTKLHEEVISGSIEDVHRYFAENNAKNKGEFVVLIEALK